MHTPCQYKESSHPIFTFQEGDITMANHRISAVMQRISIPIKILIVSLLCLVISLVVFFSTVSPILAVIAVLAFGASVCSAATILFSVIAKAKGKLKKPFLYFILTDVLLILAAVAYGIYNIKTDKGMMAGMTGYLLLYYAVPLLIGLGVLSGLIYLIARHLQKKKLQ